MLSWCLLTWGIIAFVSQSPSSMVYLYHPVWNRSSELEWHGLFYHDSLPWVFMFPSFFHSCFLPFFFLMSCHPVWRLTWSWQWCFSLWSWRSPYLIGSLTSGWLLSCFCSTLPSWLLALCWRRGLSSAFSSCESTHGTLHHAINQLRKQSNHSLREGQAFFHLTSFFFLIRHDMIVCISITNEL